jgi:O-acetylhomoserine/O-acetylserine sulfhydrylase-like pyridoxal-dependent enzyme
LEQRLDSAQRPGLDADAGTAPGFIRISAALEDAEDIVADLAHAPEKAYFGKER